MEEEKEISNEDVTYLFSFVLFYLPYSLGVCYFKIRVASNSQSHFKRKCEKYPLYR